MTQPLTTFRDTLIASVPRWLRGPIILRILYSMGIQADALGDRLAEGIRARWPDAGRSDALAVIGASRRIRRGPAEDDTTYASRLLPWLDAHRGRGGPYALLSQVSAFWNAAFDVALTYESGTAFELPAGGSITHRTAAPFDTDAAHWARWWLWYTWPHTVHTDGIWSDAGTWDDGGVWDSDLTPDTVADLRAVPQDWNTAHAFGKIVLLADGAETWDIPAGLWSDPGTWDEGERVTLSIQ